MMTALIILASIVAFVALHLATAPIAVETASHRLSHAGRHAGRKFVDRAEHFDYAFSAVCFGAAVADAEGIDNAIDASAIDTDLIEHVKQT